MKKLSLFLIGLMIFGNSAFAAQDVTFRFDTGNEKSIEITLSGTPSTTTTVTLPNNALGFKLYPRTNSVRFSVNQTLAAVATSSSQTVAATDMAVGGIAKNDQWEVRILPPYYGVTRTLSINSATASVVCDLEVF